MVLLSQQIKIRVKTIFKSSKILLFIFSPFTLYHVENEKNKYKLIFLIILYYLTLFQSPSTTHVNGEDEILIGTFNSFFK